MRFPALSVARQVLKAGQGYPTALNAANEVAVKAFIDGKISFQEIVPVCMEALEQTEKMSLTHIDEVLEADKQARAVADKIIHKKNIF